MADPRRAALNVAQGFDHFFAAIGEENRDLKSDMMSDGIEYLRDGIDEALRYLRYGE